LFAFGPSEAAAEPLAAPDQHDYSKGGHLRRQQLEIILNGEATEWGAAIQMATNGKSKLLLAWARPMACGGMSLCRLHSDDLRGAASQPL